MRRCEIFQHREVLVMAEPVAQLLRLAHPGAADLRPQRNHQVHLVAVNDHALAQLVQRLRRRLRPISRNGLARACVGGGEPVGDGREGDMIERPAPRRGGRVIERVAQPFAQVIGEGRGLCGPAEGLEPALERPARGHRELLLAEIRQPVDRSEEHTSELQSLAYLVCRLLLEKKKTIKKRKIKSKKKKKKKKKTKKKKKQ